MWKILDLIFSNCNINPNPTHLSKHQTLSPNHQFSQRISYVECYSVYGVNSEISLDTGDPASNAVVKCSVLSVFNNQRCAECVCVFVLWTSCRRVQMHYYYMWPFAKKLYHGWISTMTSSNEISWRLPPPKWRAGCAPDVLLMAESMWGVHAHRDIKWKRSILPWDGLKRMSMRFLWFGRGRDIETLFWKA